MKRRDLLKMGVLTALIPTSLLVAEQPEKAIAAEPKFQPQMIGVSAYIQNGQIVCESKVCGPNLSLKQCGGYRKHEVAYDLEDRFNPVFRGAGAPIVVTLKVTYNELWQEEYATFVAPKGGQDEALRLLSAVMSMTPEELFAGAYADKYLGRRDVGPIYSLHLDRYDFKLASVKCDTGRFPC